MASTHEAYSNFALLVFGLVVSRFLRYCNCSPWYCRADFESNSHGMQPALHIDDQDFQPTKRQKTACKLHPANTTPASDQRAALKARHATSRGKENVAPAASLQHEQQKATTQPSSSASCPRKACLTLPAPTALAAQQHRLEAPTSATHSGRAAACNLPVRAFFTKSGGRQTWHGRVLPINPAHSDQFSHSKAQQLPSAATSASSAQAKLQNSEAAFNTLPSFQQQKPDAVPQADASASDCHAELEATQAMKYAQHILSATVSLSCNKQGSSLVPSSAVNTRPTQALQHDCTSTLPSNGAQPQTTSLAPSPLPGNFIVLDASDSDSDDASDDDCAELKTQAMQSEQAVLSWLQQHGMSAYAAAFSQAEVDLDLIPCLTDADLKQMGIAALGPRRKILAAASKLARHCNGSHSSLGDLEPPTIIQSDVNQVNAQWKLCIVIELMQKSSFET